MMEVIVGTDSHASALRLVAQGLPVMISAFWLSPTVPSDPRIVLDSGGYAAARHGGFPFSPAEYVERAAGWKWTAAMDWASRDPTQRRPRTVDLWHQLAEHSHDLVPVIQGSSPSDYVRCVEEMHPRPGLVGVGSLVGRPLGSVVAIARAVFGALPSGSRLHLFGVKREQLDALLGWRALASIDSHSWHWQAYREMSKPRTSLGREAVAVAWYRRMLLRIPEVQTDDPPTLSLFEGV